MQHIEYTNISVISSELYTLSRCGLLMMIILCSTVFIQHLTGYVTDYAMIEQMFSGWFNLGRIIIGVCDAY